ncbi:ATP12 family chaperone protein [Profundibacter sp.]|uniref:ATP12 family chaperone protein n=1 Tax=Profundibacter sp. TaxID=3101071 RepID=UPI003D112340
MAEWAAKRFWEKATVENVGDGYQVLLDGRKLRTPVKSELIVPSREMAEAIAAEWDAQEEKIDPMTMPVTRSANAAIDKVGPMHAEVAALVAEYGDTDLLCYRAESPKGLVKRQSEAWDPLLEWAAGTLNAPLKTTTGIVHVKQDAAVLASLAGRVSDMDKFKLAAFHDLVGMSGSLIIGFAVIHRFLPVPELWRRSRIDEDWQIEQWGEDEEAATTEAGKRGGFEHAARFYFMVNNG